VYRSKRLVVRLDANEQCAILSLAKAERLPVSTLARRLLLEEADRRGLCSREVDRKQGAGHA